MNQNQKALAYGIATAACFVGVAAVTNYFDKRNERKHSAKMRELRAHSAKIMTYNDNLNEFNAQLDKAIETAKFWDIVTRED